MKLLAIIIIFFMGNLFAAIPTVEGLFRNGNNKDLSGNFVVLKFNITEVPTEDAINKVNMNGAGKQNGLADALLSKIYPVKYCKFIFSLETEGKFQLLQVVYSKSNMNNDSLVSVNYIPDLNNSIVNDSGMERRLLYSLLMMFSLNESSGIASILKSHNQNFIDNKSLLNIDKKNLLEKYKEYLLAIKKDKDSMVNIKSPLSSDEPIEKAKISKILNSGMYSKAPEVKLIRENKIFYWEVAYENFNALFEHQSHRLNKINMVVKEGTISGLFGDFILFDGIHELPKTVILKDTQEKKFKIRILSLREFTNKGKLLAIRATKYFEKLNASKNKLVVFPSDRFFY